MHNACVGVESVAEMIARLVCEYEARQAVKGKDENNSNTDCLTQSLTSKAK